MGCRDHRKQLEGYVGAHSKAEDIHVSIRGRDEVVDMVHESRGVDDPRAGMPDREKYDHVGRFVRSAAKLRNGRIEGPGDVAGTLWLQIGNVGEGQIAVGGIEGYVVHGKSSRHGGKIHDVEVIAGVEVLDHIGSSVFGLLHAGVVHHAAAVQHKGKVFLDHVGAGLRLHNAHKEAVAEVVRHVLMVDKGAEGAGPQVFHGQIIAEFDIEVQIEGACHQVH